MRRSTSRFIVIASVVYCGMLSIVAGAQDAVQALQQRLMAPPATVTLNAPQLGLWKVNRADVRVKSGNIELRMANTLIKPDEIAPQNTVLHVKKVEASSEKKNDYLRITVASDGGSSAPLAFELAKGALAGMDESALEQLISPILTLPAGGAPPMSPIAPPPAPADQPMAAIAPPPPPTDSPIANTSNGSGSNAAAWQIKPSNDSQEAYLAGTIHTNGQSSPILLGLSCNVYPKIAGQRQAPPLLISELRIRHKALPFNPRDCEDGAANSAEGKIKIGDQPEKSAAVCMDVDQFDDTLSVLSVLFEPSHSTWRDMLSTKSGPVRIRLGLGEPTGEVIAEFQLPSESSQVRALIAPCLSAEAKPQSTSKK